MARYDEGLNVRHALAREVIRALALIYSDGALCEEDQDIVGRAIDVLMALQNRGQKEKADASSTFA